MALTLETVKNTCVYRPVATLPSQTGRKYPSLTAVVGKRRQFADGCYAQNLRLVIHDIEFSDLLDALPADLSRVLTWVDEGTDPPAGFQTIDDIVAANSFFFLMTRRPPRSPLFPTRAPSR